MTNPLSISNLIAAKSAQIASATAQPEQVVKVPGKRGRPAANTAPKPTSEELRAQAQTLLQTQVSTRLAAVASGDVPGTEIAPDEQTINLRGFFPATMVDVSENVRGRKNRLYLNFVQKDKDADAKGEILATYVPMEAVEFALKSSPLFRRVCNLYLAGCQTDENSDGSGYNRAHAKVGLELAAHDGEFSDEQNEKLSTLLNSYVGQLHARINGLSGAEWRNL